MPTYAQDYAFIYRLFMTLLHFRLHIYSYQHLRSPYRMQKAEQENFHLNKTLLYAV